MSTPQPQYYSSSRSHIFAVITPVSTDAIACLDVHHNASYVTPREDAIASLRLRLDFQSILGRPSLSFGSSNRDNILLRGAGTSDGDGIEARHFVIHFEMQTGLLLLTDTSGTGTWISDEATLSSTLLHSTTYPLTRPTIIILGHRRQFRFMVTVTDYINCPPFNNLFQSYARSINKPSPSFVRPFCTSGSRLTVIRGTSEYFRLHKIHKSCSGTVHLSLRMKGGSLFAVKTFAKSSMKNARNQVRVLQRTRHPNIIKFVEYSPTSGTLIMEFLPQGSLASLLDSWQPCSLQIPFCQAVLRQCLVAVQYLNHLDLIHHDLEPDKVLFVSVAPVRIKLCNFSGARSIVHAHALPTSVPFTPGYTPPEFNTRLHGFGVDVYSLGIIALNMLGFWPWKGVDTLPDYRHLPCSDLLDSMLDIDTSRRYTPSDCLDHVWLRKSTRSTKRRLSTDPTTYFPPSKRQKVLGAIPCVTQRPTDSRLKPSILDSLIDSTWKSAIHVHRRTWLRVTETCSNYFRGV